MGAVRMSRHKKPRWLLFGRMNTYYTYIATGAIDKMLSVLDGPATCIALFLYCYGFVTGD